MGEVTRICPTCGRQIIVEHGRFTRHSDKRFWDHPPPLPSCPMSDVPVSPTPPGDQP